MIHDEMEKVYVKAIEFGHRLEYIEGLRKCILQASEEALLICREWNGDKFGYPGHGGDSWVAVEISKAEKAVMIMKKQFGRY